MKENSYLTGLPVLELCQGVLEELPELLQGLGIMEDFLSILHMGQDILERVVEGHQELHQVLDCPLAGLDLGSHLSDKLLPVLIQME